MHLIKYNMWVKIRQLDALTFIYEQNDRIVKPTVASALRFKQMYEPFQVVTRPNTLE